jgi:SAM-dependent methyltransferase
MPLPKRTVFDLPPVKALLNRELDALAPLLQGIYGQVGLYLGAEHAALPELPTHLLNVMLPLRVAPGRQLDGAVRCAFDALPFAGESLKLVVVQHAAEALTDSDALAAEIVRVLAPEGVALIFGFNPTSLWRPWLAWRSRGRDCAGLSIRSAHSWSALMRRGDVDTLQVRYLGSLMPALSAVSDEGPIARALDPLRASYLLLARKRKSTLTPIRLRSATRERTLQPQLAPGAQRAQA